MGVPRSLLSFCKGIVLACGVYNLVSVLIALTLAEITNSPIDVDHNLLYVLKFITGIINIGIFFLLHDELKNKGNLHDK